MRNVFAAQATVDFAWARDVADVAQTLDSDAESGLSSAQAQARLEQFGPNDLPETQHAAWWQLLLHQFTNTMTLVLLVACGITVFIGDAEDVIIILAIVVLNALVGFVQEYRSEHAIRALKAMAAPLARVRRGNVVSQIPARELVPGDVLELDAGDVVAADARLIATAALSIDEAALTGESLPVLKSTATLTDRDALLPDRANMVFRGTAVVAGRGRALIVATGAQTQLGAIAASLQSTTARDTPLQKRLAALGRTLAILAIGVCGLVLGIGLVQGQPLDVMLLTAVSLAVAAVPEALPAVVTIALALGAQRMAQRHAIVRRLPAVETLGSVTVICTDKTGTLTTGRMTVEQALAASDVGVAASDDLGNALSSSDGRPSLALVAVLCNDAHGTAVVDGDRRVLGDPTEVALLEFGERSGLDGTKARQRWPRVAEFPFDTGRRSMTTIHRDPEGGFFVASKGAPDAILPRVQGRTCGLSDVRAGGGSTMDWQEQAEQLAQQGLRVLALAGRTAQTIPRTQEDAEKGLVLYGLVGMADPPRPSSAAAVEACRQAGIIPVMITGDHAMTAATIARQVGLSGEKVFTGRQVSDMATDGLGRDIQSVDVFARIAPEQKLAIVKAWQARGAVVAMTGDGVNDGPALRQADIGIAMGRMGTEVAREASDMVLADDNFATIVTAVKEGRRIYDNIRRFVRFSIATNAAEVGLMVFGPLLGLPLPLLPVHILWVNLVTDGLPGIGLGVEAAEPDALDRPPRLRDEDLFAGGMWSRILVGAGLMTVAVLGVGLWARAQERPWQTIVFTTLALLQLAHALALRSERRSIFRVALLTNPLLLLTLGCTTAIQIGIVYWPPAQHLLKVQPLSWFELAVVLGVSSLAFWFVELEKLALAGCDRRR